MLLCDDGIKAISLENIWMKVARGAVHAVCTMFHSRIAGSSEEATNSNVNDDGPFDGRNATQIRRRMTNVKS